MAQKLTISNPNNVSGQRKKAKKAKKDLRKFANDYAADAQAAFNGMGNGPKIDKLRDLVLALIDQNINLHNRIQQLEAK